MSNPAASMGADASDVVQAFERLPALTAADPGLVRRGRFLSGEIEIGVGAVPLAVSIAAGRVEAVRRGPFLLRPLMFAIRAEPDVWRRFTSPFRRRAGTTFSPSRRSAGRGSTAISSR